MKHIFTARYRIVSTASKRIFYCTTPSGTAYFDCQVLNVIYIITCSRCSLQYDEKTGQKKKEKLNLHKAKTLMSIVFVGYYLIISIKEYVKMLYIQSNFWKKLMIMGQLRMVNWMLQPHRKESWKEKECMLKLRIVFCYGNKDRLCD